MTARTLVNKLANSLALVSLAGNDNTARSHVVLKDAAFRAHETLESTKVERDLWRVWVSTGRVSTFYAAQDAIDFAKGQCYVTHEALAHATHKLLAGCVVGWTYGTTQVEITPPIPSDAVCAARDCVVSAAMNWENEAGSVPRAELLRAVRDLRGTK